MSQAPTVSLPKRLPLVTAPENRGTSPDKDSRLVNCYAERSKMDGEFWLFKRAGLLRAEQPSGGAAAGLGMFNWLGDIYAIFGTTLYKNGASVGTVDATTSYRFDSTLGATPQLQLGNGVKAYNYDSGSGLVEITDSDFPADFVKGWAYLDGTTYVGVASPPTIQGSDINDPTAWDALNFLSAQIEPDQLVALSKQLVYVVAFKQWSTEIFYDAGNATGSPLGPVQGAKASYGCVSADSIQSIDGMLIWVSTNQSASTQIIKMEGLKVEVISTNPIERLLDAADFTEVYSLQFKNIGHRFYIFTSVNSNLTLVYDLDEKLWHQWTDSDGNYFPFSAVTYDAATYRHQFQHESDGWIYLVNEGYYTDEGEPITADIYTPNFDGDTYRRKTLNVMKFVADKTPGSVLQVRHNDSDYEAGQWTNFRSVDLSQKAPMLMGEGTFVRRAYNFRHQSATQMRIKAVELQMDLGTL